MHHSALGDCRHRHVGAENEARRCRLDSRARPLRWRIPCAGRSRGGRLPCKPQREKESAPRHISGGRLFQLLRTGRQLDVVDYRQTERVDRLKESIQHVRHGTAPQVADKYRFRCVYSSCASYRAQQALCLDCRTVSRRISAVYRTCSQRSRKGSPLLTNRGTPDLATSS